MESTPEQARTNSLVTFFYGPLHVDLANAPVQAETLLHSLERAAAGIGFHVNAQKMEYIRLNQTGDISALNGSSLKLVHLPRTYCLINRDGYQHATSKGIDCYR